MVRRRNKQKNRNHIQIPPMAIMVRRRNKQKNRNHIQIPPMAATASSPSAPPVPPPPPWTELPADVTANILRRLGVEDILSSAEKVCTTWKNICRDPTTWRVVHLTSNRRDDDRELGLMCRFAVVRSQGHLTDLSMYYFGDDELLNYVALRCRNLRRLTLAGPSDISHTGLSNAVKKLPHLEELHLFKTWPPDDAKYAKLLRWLMGDGYVHTIGICCPLLRSFTYNEKWGAGSFSETDNVIAEVIAKTMPNLHHLRLKGNLMDNEGLEAILDGCPRLESLDIRECYCLDLEAGGLGERCSKQIKFVKLPLKSIE